MNIRKLVIVSFVLGAAGCAEKESVTPTTGKPAEATSPVPAHETGLAVGTGAFVRHMHEHAKQLERLNEALAAGDLESARLPAFWLSRHQGMSSPYEGWQPHLATMRDAADAVENAADLEAARAASQRISEGCDGCHRAAGVEIASLGSKRLY